VMELTALLFADCNYGTQKESSPVCLRKLLW
jgi:hypothetical protein